jgi:hypothetical protein
MHALRIAYQGIELITEGWISLPVPEPARSRLTAVRRGELPLEQVIADLRQRTAELEEAVMRAQLPDEADHAAVDAFLIRAYEESWSVEPG